MRVFKYKARTVDGNLVRGVVEAYDEFEAMAQVRQNDLLVEKIMPLRERKGIRRDIDEPLWISEKILSLTASQFAIMLKAGLSMSHVIELIAEQTNDRLMKRILAACAGDVAAGYSLAQSLEKNGKGIPAAFIEAIRAGEETGTLETCFLRLKLYYDKAHRLKRKVRSAFVYPIILLAAAAIVVGIVMIVLVPSMISMFSEMGSSLPLPTRILIAASDFLASSWPFLFICISVIMISMKLYGKTKRGSVLLGKIRLKLPVLGKIARMNAASQFANTLNMLLSAGLPAVKALLIISRVMDNRAVGESIEQNVIRLEAGERMGDILRNNAYLPAMLAEMAAVGEEAGMLEETMEIIGAYYDEESEAASNQALSLLEPAITIIMGILVAFIVIAVYLPMFTMETNII